MTEKAAKSQQIKENGKWKCECGRSQSVPPWVDDYIDDGGVVHECSCGRSHLLGRGSVTYIGRTFFEGDISV